MVLFMGLPLNSRTKTNYSAVCVLWESVIRIDDRHGVEGGGGRRRRRGEKKQQSTK